jgi:diphthamide synthase (EF-2-diphthine--ammonia ligase)
MFSIAIRLYYFIWCGVGTIAGEFHTFVYDAPVFSSPIEVETGEIVERDGFVFADVVPHRD